MMQTPEQVRETLDRLIKERGFGYAAISRMIQRNAAYIQQFITRGRPARLDENDRRTIADFLGVDEQLLGGPDRGSRASEDTVQVRRLFVEASAGPGSIVDGELLAGQFGFNRSWLRQITRAKPEDLSTIKVKGDSMAPTLSNGDEALIDQSRRDPRDGDGIYVLRRDDTLMIKRLTISPSSILITISSDNPTYPTWRDCSPASLQIIGRAIATVRAI